MNREKKLRLYLHIPFCRRKCEYCDFLSAPAGRETQEEYVSAMLKEISYQAPKYSTYSVPSLFIGGGTPSVLSGEQITRILEAVHSSFSIEPGAEQTIECNPGTLNLEKLSFYRSAGLNRLSIGLQSARDEELKLLGRIHTFQDFLETYRMARKAGFSNINVDLMSALPGQSPKDWEYSLRQAAGLLPEHISAYSLIIEEGTPFYGSYGGDNQRREEGERPLLLPDEETERAMYNMTEEILDSLGYLKYEISNHAKPGYECSHNTGYWTRENYLGLGLGSASLVEETRTSNTKSLEKYLNLGFEPEEKEKLSVSEQMEEFMFLGLRLTRGVSTEKFQENFGRTLEEIYGEQLKKLISQGLLEGHGDRIFLTREGVFVSNYVMAEFLQ